MKCTLVCTEACRSRLLVCPSFTFDLCPYHPHRKRLRRQRGCISSPHRHLITYRTSCLTTSTGNQQNITNTHTHARLLLRNLAQTPKFGTSGCIYCPTAAQLTFYTSFAKSRLHTDCFSTARVCAPSSVRLLVWACGLRVEIFFSYCRGCRV